MLIHSLSIVIKSQRARRAGISAYSINRIIPYLIVALSLLYFTIMAGTEISIPGLNYDEVLFVNAATGAVGDSFIYKRLGGVPIMLMSYIGALKSYLYFPIFKIFGVSAATIRFPAILISSGSILIAYLISRLTFNEFESAMLVLIMAVDPVFIFMTKLDYGPIVLMIGLKLLAVLFFLKLVTTLSVRYLLFLVVTCLLGLYDKLNFIWFIIAFGFAAIFLFRRELQKLYKTHRLVCSLLTSLFLTLTLYVGIAMILPALLRTQQTDINVLERLRYVVSLYVRTMNGMEFYSWLTDLQLPLGTVTNYVTMIALLVITIAGFFTFWRATSKIRFVDRVIGCYAFIFALILVQIVLTQKAGGPHHIMMLYPFHHFLALAAAVTMVQGMNGHAQEKRSALAAAIYKILGHSIKEWSGDHGRKLGLGAIFLILGLLVASEIKVGMNYAQAINKETLNPSWSPVIYELADYVNRREVDEVVFVDWGIHNQVFALSDKKTRKKCFDLWLKFKGLDDPSSGTAIYNRFFRGKKVLVIAHNPEVEVMPHTWQHFLDFAKHFFGGAQLERVFTTVEGRPIFEAYYLDNNL